MRGIGGTLALGAAFLALAGCVGGGGALVGGSGSTSGTASIAPGAKWSRSWPVSGNYEVKASFAAVGGTVNAYFMTESEWNRWEAGAAPESLAVVDKKLGLDQGELTGRVGVGSTLVLVFANPGNNEVSLKWWGSFGQP